MRLASLSYISHFFHGRKDFRQGLQFKLLSYSDKISEVFVLSSELMHIIFYTLYNAEIVLARYLFLTTY